MASLGVEAYRVGGSVRDEVIGRRPKDADYMVRGITLDDLFDVLQAQGRDVRVSPLKLRDGRIVGARAARKTMGVLEIALPRTEISTGPGHRDFEIVVDPNLSLEEDAHRRDFTFNAIYRGVGALPVRSLRAGPNGQIYKDIFDPVGGLEDIIRRTVRTTTSGSFRDDPLRTLRALRFVSTLGYDLSPNTQAQMESFSSYVTGLTANGYASGTVIEEMSRILMGADVRKALRIARDTGVLGTLFPELEAMLGFDQGSRYHDMTTDEHTFAALDTAAKVDAPLRVRWSLLFHDAGKPETAWVGTDGRKHYYATFADPANPGRATEDHEVVGERLWREAATRLGATKALREDVATLIAGHMVPTQMKASKLRRMRVKYGDEMLSDLLMHRACDYSGKGVPDRNKLTQIGKLEEWRRDAKSKGVPSSTKDLEISGKDAIEKGYSGRDIGQALKRVLYDVVNEPNERTLSREWQVGRL